MEQMPNKPAKRGLPLWLLFVLIGVILVMTLTVTYVVLLYLDVIRCEVVSPVAEATPTAFVPTQNPAALISTPIPTVTEAPVVVQTEAPTQAPTAEPTEVPTEAPTEAPTPEPTPVPDTFTLGGKTVKAGSTKINGKSLGINGKSSKLTHITAEEVANLVALCPDLTELVLDYCYMDDYAPLAGLKKLQKLQLSSCGANDGNAIRNIDWVAGMTDLRSLNFAHNEISDTTALKGLTKLTYLSLGYNALTDEGIKPLGSLTKLETLYLNSQKKITDVSPLKTLEKLTFLHLGNNSKLETVKPLTALKKLVYLRLNKTKVSDLSYFGDFEALKKLDLSKCSIKVKSVRALRDCKKLEYIVLDMGDTDLYYAVLDDLINEGYPVHFLYEW